MIKQILNFFKLEAASGILLFTFALCAILFANSGLKDCYFHFLDIPIVVQIGEFIINKPLLLWVNDGFMAVFFVLVGMEVKRELFEGTLSSYQRAIFPAIAAFGGMIVPALIYYFITRQHPELTEGWAIPMATDIAFALGIVALLGQRVPMALKVFLLALAIIDDLGAIVVIALFYSHDISTTALIIAGIAIVILFTLNYYKVTLLSAYIVVGLILWASVLKSGVHATLAGVIIGFSIPLHGKNHERPLHDFEHSLAPWCSFLILPLFAFSNSGVTLTNLSLSSLVSALPLGIAAGLVVGKTLGVFGFSFLAVKLGIAKLPKNVNFSQIFAMAVVCGIGFTMSMFLATLAFGGVDSDLTSLARLGILMGSGISAVLGYCLLKWTTNVPAKAGNNA